MITCPEGWHAENVMTGLFPFVTMTEQCVKNKEKPIQDPAGPGKNPHGGGGNQWIPAPYDFPVSRQGDYGVQRTFSGKTVNRRLRHNWSIKDVLRVSKAFEKAGTYTIIGDDWTILDFVIQTIDHILNGVGLISDLPRGILNWTLFLRGVSKWFLDNRAWQETWQPRWERAVENFWKEL